MKERRTKKRRKPKRDEPAFAGKLGRLGVVGRQPLLWMAATALLATAGGTKGRKAATRGLGCYFVGAAVGNLPKPLFRRPQPRYRKPKKPEIMRGSFPSGHAAAEVGYVFGAAQELPLSFLPLGTMALLAHWSLVRTGKHFISDTLVGGTMGLLVAVAAYKVWPPNPAAELVDAVSRKVQASP
jgi:membrane-associated phospholipid phosphatase